VILAAGRSEADSEVARAALAQLCQTYWAPLYTFVRSRGYVVHDAQDLTQSFFVYLIEKKIYARVNRQKGKFRSFLLASLKNFLADAYDREQTLKRGGAHDFLPLKEEQAEEAESLFQTHCTSGSDATGEDRVFERSWAQMLVAAGLERLSADYKAEGKEKIFLELKIFLTGAAEPLPHYADLAERLGTIESTLRSHITRLRARYREALRAEVRRTVETEAEIDGELRELLRVLTAG
jgi:RNA polymerase sigma-70 factor (ECF subfamily)